MAKSGTLTFMCGSSTLFIPDVGSVLKVPLPSVKVGGCAGRSEKKSGASGTCTRSASDGTIRPTVFDESCGTVVVPMCRHSAPPSKAPQPSESSSLTCTPMPRWYGSAPSGSTSVKKVVDGGIGDGEGAGTMGTQSECGSPRPPPSMPSDRPLSATLQPPATARMSIDACVPGANDASAEPTSIFDSRPISWMQLPMASTHWPPVQAVANELQSSLVVQAMQSWPPMIPEICPPSCDSSVLAMVPLSRPTPAHKSGVEPDSLVLMSPPSRPVTMT